MIETITTDSGKAYNLSKLTVKDMIEFKSSLRYAKWHELNNIRDQFPPEMVEKELDNLFHACANKTVTEGDIESNAFALEGASYLLWLSLKKNHEKITKDECAEILTIHNLEPIIKKLLMLSGMWEEQKTLKVKMLKDWENKVKDKIYTVGGDTAKALIELGFAEEVVKKNQPST